MGYPLMRILGVKELVYRNGSIARFSRHPARLNKVEYLFLPRLRSHFSTFFCSLSVRIRFPHISDIFTNSFTCSLRSLRRSIFYMKLGDSCILEPFSSIAPANCPFRLSVLERFHPWPAKSRVSGISGLRSHNFSF